MNENEIIDFEKKGNQVRFYLGKNGEQWGDDWNDKPYEHNAGEVYTEYVSGYQDISFDFDDYVLEPSDGYVNSKFSKEDMVKRKVPCIIIIKKEDINSLYDLYYGFDVYIGDARIKKYYFGDVLDDN